MRTVILTVALSVVSFFATSQTFENPKVYKNGDRIEFMEWYKQPDGKLMMNGYANDIDVYTSQLLEYYGLDDVTPTDKGMRVWRAISHDNTFKLEMIVVINNNSGTILIKEN
jgi:hypothetical protein